MKKLFILIVIATSHIGIALANDSAGAISAGGITFVKTSAISMDREELTISPNNVKVAYLFKNNTDKDVSTQVFFPLPPYKGGGVIATWDNELGSTKDAPFVNFSLSVQGQPTNYNTHIRALMDGKDITQTLQQAKIPLNPALVAGEIPMQDQTNLNQWQTKARELNLLDAGGKPKWQKQIVYYWTQTFPAHQEILIEHQYKPATGVFYAGNNPGKTPKELLDETTQRMNSLFKLDFAKAIGEKTMKNWLLTQFQQNTNNNIYAYFYAVNYILTTGANWKGPIKNFTLDIVKPSGSLVAYNSFYGQRTPGINTDDPNHIVIFLHNFVPQKDLQVLYATPSQLQ